MQSGRGFPSEDDEKKGPVMQARASRRRLVTRVANSARGHGAGVLVAAVGASMITKQEVLADQQHRGGDTTSHDKTSHA